MSRIEDNARITETLRVDFDIKCRKCGSDNVRVDDDMSMADDGDGYVDAMGSLDIICGGCGNIVTLKPFH